MDSCCRLGTELDLKKNILYETEHFFVVPTIGQIGIEGYVLLCSKEHLIGVGNVPEEHESELEKVLAKTRNVLSKAYNPEILVFEHGPKLRCHRGGSCLDHAHLHLVPTSVNVMEFLEKIFKPEQITDLSRLREIYKDMQSSYLFVETQNRKRYVIEANIPIPSQYLRQVIASKLGIKDWDWRTAPDYKTFEKTLNHLRGKF